MSDSNRRKDELLGEPHGTASNRLRKLLLFKYVQLAGADRCHRCLRTIDSVDELSIEHKTSWQLSADPKRVFFDLDDVVFSHLKCNVTAADRSREFPPRQHGTITMYKRGLCRCPECRAANARVEHSKRLRVQI